MKKYCNICGKILKKEDKIFEAMGKTDMLFFCKKCTDYIIQGVQEGRVLHKKL